MKKLMKYTLCITLLFAMTFIMTGCQKELKEGFTRVSISSSGYQIQMPSNYDKALLKDENFSYLQVTYKYEEELNIPDLGIYKIEGINKFNFKEYLKSVCEDMTNYKISEVEYGGVTMERHEFNEMYEGRQYHEDEYFFKGLDDAFFVLCFTGDPSNFPQSKCLEIMETFEKIN